MLERFNDAARRVLLDAEEAARKCGRETVETEDYVLALAARPGLVSEVFTAMGLTYDNLAEEFGGREESATPTPKQTRLEYSPHLKSVLYLTLRVMLERSSQVIEPVDLALALIRERNAPQLGAIMRLGVAPNDLRERLLAAVKEQADAAKV